MPAPASNPAPLENQPLILVVSETPWEKLERVTFELLADARKLANAIKGRVELILLCSPTHSQALLSELSSRVHEPIHLMEHPDFAEYSTEQYVNALSGLLESLEPKIVFLAATANGRDLGPRLAARRKCAYFPHCLTLKASSDQKLEITRVTHGGRVHVQAAWPIAETAILTMKPGVADPVAADKSPQTAPAVKRHDVSMVRKRVRVRKRIPADPKTLDIREAERLVSGGRGVGGKQGFDVLRALADALGASLAASRAAVDLGWVEYDRQVGQTGKAVSPKLYLAAGISGASHHLMGMKESEKIVAVNLDKQAPIFSAAHFGVLGDLHLVLPKLTDKILKAKTNL
jgi:electron transfer flavoprotein alpha subunit